MISKLEKTAIISFVTVMSALAIKGNYKKIYDIFNPKINKVYVYDKYLRKTNSHHKTKYQLNKNFKITTLR